MPSKKPIKRPSMPKGATFSTKHSDECMAEGGEVKEPMVAVKNERSGETEIIPAKPGIMDHVKEAFKDSATRANIDQARKRQQMAEGGMVDGERDIVDSILSKRSKGPQDMADLSQNAEEGHNLEDDLSFEALRKEIYDESSALEDATQPMDSNRKGQALDDEHDEEMIEAIRRKRASRG